MLLHQLNDAFLVLPFGSIISFKVHMDNVHLIMIDPRNQNRTVHYDQSGDHYSIQYMSQPNRTDIILAGYPDSPQVVNSTHEFKGFPFDVEDCIVKLPDGQPYTVGSNFISLMMSNTLYYFAEGTSITVSVLEKYKAQVEDLLHITLTDRIPLSHQMRQWGYRFMHQPAKAIQVDDSSTLLNENKSLLIGENRIPLWDYAINFPDGQLFRFHLRFIDGYL